MVKNCFILRLGIKELGVTYSVKCELFITESLLSSSQKNATQCWKYVIQYWEYVTQCQIGIIPSGKIVLSSYCKKFCSVIP